MATADGIRSSKKASGSTWDTDAHREALGKVMHSVHLMGEISKPPTTVDIVLPDNVPNSTEGPPATDTIKREEDALERKRAELAYTLSQAELTLENARLRVPEPSIEELVPLEIEVEKAQTVLNDFEKIHQNIL